MEKKKHYKIPAEWLQKQMNNNKDHRDTFDENEENDFVNGEQSAYSEIKNLFPITETSVGVELISQEREEQIKKHGFSLEGDRAYVNNELIDAAMQYLGGGDISCWPESWDKMWYTPGDRIEELKRAGALIAAEIDRITYYITPSSLPGR
jgi:hypothetical protein